MNNGWRSAEDNNNALLTNAEARAARFIHFWYELPGVDLAKMYGVSTAAMSLLLRGVTYAEAGGPTAVPRSHHRRAA